MEEIGDAEQRLHLSRGTLLGLSKYDDWAYVVALSALLETAATGLLRQWVEPKVVADSVAGWPYSKKLVTLKALGVHPDAVAMAQGLSRLRNTLSHDVAKLVGFSLEQLARTGEGRRLLIQQLHLTSPRWSSGGRSLADMALRESPKGLLVMVAAIVLDGFAANDHERRSVQSAGRTSDWLRAHDPEMAGLLGDALIQELTGHYSESLGEKDSSEAQ
jgi:hypothetical protein